MKSVFNKKMIVTAWCSVFAMGCSRDAQVHAPEPTMTPASSEANLAPSNEPEQPPSLIVVEESIRVSCNLPNDRETAPRFDYDQAQLRPRGMGILNGVALCLREGPMKSESITVVGHADPRGSEDYNQQLGRKRAESARDYLAQQGLTADRVKVVSRGESAATGTDESSWATDRRIEVRRGDVTP